ncbi:putative transducin family protein [Paratrimastix pyriformis]|uniref:Transducin family protein n=1 Tax=Paratrimastix pyriformis TaxID=342808 RepID=A0ABQ8UVC5_9EUKA|nr:putative transducin family protein [Paratrimastix pyriformis]
MQLPRYCTRTLEGHQGAVLVVRFNSDGNYCLTGGQDHTIRLWNPRRGNLVQTFRGHGYEVFDIAVETGNAHFASCGGDKDVFIWDVGATKVIRRLRGHNQKVNAVRYNEDCSLLISASFDQTVRIWDLRSKSFTPIQVLDDFKDSVSGLALTNREIIASCVDGCVRTYDIAAGQLRTDTLGTAITCVSVSHDGNCILCSCLDGTLRLIDRSNGTLLCQYKGHQNTRYKVESCLSPDDSHVVSGSEEGAIFMWSLVEGQVVRKLEGHRNVSCSLAFHPSTHEDAMLVSASVDGTVKVWNTQQATEQPIVAAPLAAAKEEETPFPETLPRADPSKLPFSVA